LSLDNCARCGRIFFADKSDLCPGCEAEDEKKLWEIRAFLREEGPATMEEVHQKTGVSKDLILKFIQRGNISCLEPRETGEDDWREVF